MTAHREPRVDAPTVASEPFRVTVRIVDEAKRCLLDAIPTTRLPGRALADALSEFETLLVRAADELRVPVASEIESEWRAAQEGIARSLALVRDLRERASGPDRFEGLIAVVGELLDPLDAFDAVGDRFRDLAAASPWKPRLKRASRSGADAGGD